MEIGDRVVYVGSEEGRYCCDLKDGDTGVIRELSFGFPPIGVEWDRNVGGHDLDCNCPYGHGYYVYSDDIECIGRTSEDTHDSISAHTPEEITAFVMGE